MYNNHYKQFIKNPTAQDSFVNLRLSDYVNSMHFSNKEVQNQIENIKSIEDFNKLTNDGFFMLDISKEEKDSIISKINEILSFSKQSEIETYFVTRPDFKKPATVYMAVVKTKNAEFSFNFEPKTLKLRDFHLVLKGDYEDFKTSPLTNENVAKFNESINSFYKKFMKAENSNFNFVEQSFISSSLYKTKDYTLASAIVILKPIQEDFPDQDPYLFLVDTKTNAVIAVDHYSQGDGFFYSEW